MLRFSSLLVVVFASLALTAAGGAVVPLLQQKREACRGLNRVGQEISNDKVVVHGYDKFYCDKLYPLRNMTGLTLIEVGFGCGHHQHGSGSYLFKKFFTDVLGSEVKIWSVDWNGNPKVYNCTKEFYSRFPRGTIVEDVFPGDQANKTFIAEVAHRTGARDIDIVIDDGGHHGGQIISTMGVLWPLLPKSERNNYIIEDLQLFSSDDSRSALPYLLGFTDQLISLKNHTRLTPPSRDVTYNRWEGDRLEEGGEWFVWPLAAPRGLLEISFSREIAYLKKSYQHHSKKLEGPSPATSDVCRVIFNTMRLSHIAENARYYHFYCAHLTDLLQERRDIALLDVGFKDCGKRALAMRAIFLSSTNSAVATESSQPGHHNVSVYTIATSAQFDACGSKARDAHLVKSYVDDGSKKSIDTLLGDIRGKIDVVFDDASNEGFLSNINGLHASLRPTGKYLITNINSKDTKEDRAATKAILGWIDQLVAKRNSKPPNGPDDSLNYTWVRWPSAPPDGLHEISCRRGACALTQGFQWAYEYPTVVNRAAEVMLNCFENKGLGISKSSQSCT